MARDHQSCHAGDPADGGGDASSAGRGCLQRCGGQGLLGGEEDRVVIHAPVSQLLAHDTGQGTAAGLTDVGDAEFAGVQLVAGAKSRDGGDPALPGVHDEAELAAYQIDAVGNVAVVRVEEVELVLLGVELADGADVTVGVDVPDAVGHGLGLKLSQGGMEGAELAV